MTLICYTMMCEKTDLANAVRIGALRINP